MISRGFSFKVEAKVSKTKARAGVLNTPHGKIMTPVFMPVGTQASVKSLSPDDLIGVGAQIILGNTYHLYLRPGEKRIKNFGGIHEFMKWDRPILTDSGGYQVSSLGSFIDESANPERKKMTLIDNEGVTFVSHLDGSCHRFSPEKSIEIQESLGSDIIMAFDEATPNRGKRYARVAMERTHKWLERSVKRWQEFEKRKRVGEKSQAMFGIIQGGGYSDLRKISAEFVAEQNLDGIAMGGGTIGQNQEETQENVSWVIDLLPKDKPLYLMGVGVNPEDVISAIESGADMFDCVAPTRLARMGQLYSGELKNVRNGFKFESEFRHGRMNIANARFKNDCRIIQTNCDCYTCTSGFTRAYLNHLFKCRELLYYRLASIHNLRFIIRIVEKMREALVL